MDYQYRPYQQNFYTEENTLRRRAISKDTAKLGGILLLYYIITTLFAYGIYYVMYFYYTNSICLDYDALIIYLRDNHYEFLTSTVFVMSANAAITVLSLIIVLLLGKFLLKADFGGFFTPNVKGIKMGALWVMPCFVVNMICSLVSNILSNFFAGNGILIPESDFSLSEPSMSSLLVQALYVIILAPILEEIIYRGIILGMLSKHSKTTAVLVSALAFGLMHGNIPQAISAFGTGFVYATIAVNCGSIIPTIIIHMVNNILASYADFETALNIPHGDLIFCFVTITFALLGFLILFTKIKQLKLNEEPSPVSTSLTRKTIFTNPVLLLYLAILVWDILKAIIRAN